MYYFLTFYLKSCIKIYVIYCAQHTIWADEAGLVPGWFQPNFDCDEIDGNINQIRPGRVVGTLHLHMQTPDVRKARRPTNAPNDLSFSWWMGQQSCMNLPFNINSKKKKKRIQIMLENDGYPLQYHLFIILVGCSVYISIPACFTCMQFYL